MAEGQRWRGVLAETTVGKARRRQVLGKIPRLMGQSQPVLSNGGPTRKRELRGPETITGLSLYDNSRPSQKVLRSFVLGH